MENKLSIPEATNRKPVRLIVVGPVDIAIVVVQVAGPGVWRIVLRRTPPVAGVNNKAECSIVVTAAARQACETAGIGGSGIWRSPMGCSDFFHRTPGN